MNTASTITNDDVAINASASLSTIVNSNFDDYCVTNSSGTIWLESTYNDIELWLLCSSSISHQQQEKEKEQFSHVTVDSNNACVSNDNIRNECY